MKDFKWQYLLTGAAALGGLYFFMGMSFLQFFTKYANVFAYIFCILTFSASFLAPLIVGISVLFDEPKKGSQYMIITSGIVSVLNICTYLLGKYYFPAYDTAEAVRCIICLSKFLGAPNMLIVLFLSIKLSLKRNKE